MRSMKTVLGVVVIFGLIVFGNQTYTSRADSKEFSRIAEALARALSDESLTYANWDDLQAVGGSFSSGPKHSQYAQDREDSRIYITGYGIPLDRGKFKVASLFSLPNMVIESVFGAKPPPIGYQKRFLLTPVPMTVYFGGNPPVKETILVHMGGDDMAEFEPDVPIAISGVLDLQEGPNEFFYVLREARVEDMPGASPAPSPLSPMTN